MNDGHARGAARELASGSTSTSSTRTTGSSPARPRALARAPGVPWLVTVHATEYGRHQGWVDKHPQSHIHAVERRMVRDADRVITCSHYMRGHVADVFGVATARVTAIPNGIDPTDLQPVADLPRLRARFAAARRAAGAAGRPARLREGLPPRARRAAGG